TAVPTESSGGGTVGGTTPEEALATGGGGGSPAVTGPADDSAGAPWSSVVSPIPISVAPTATVSPTSTEMDVTTPDREAAISAIAFSVSTSITVSPSATLSPTATSTAVTRPSDTSRPIWGKTTSATTANPNLSPDEAPPSAYRLTIDPTWWFLRRQIADTLR